MGELETDSELNKSEPPQDDAELKLSNDRSPSIVVQPPPLEEDILSNDDYSVKLTHPRITDREVENESTNTDCMGKRQTKMDSTIDTIRKSWDDFHQKEVELFLLPNGKKAKIVPYVAQQIHKKDQRRRSSVTVWDLKDARESIADAQETGIKVYGRRWLMLGIFVLLGIGNMFQWVHYSVIVNIIVKYYRVSDFAVDLTALSYLIAYIIFFIPASWFLDRWGLRWSLVVAAGGTAIGSWIKVASVPRDRFWVTMLGQCVAAVAQVFILFLPPRLAAVWFDAKQVSLACSIGFIGFMIGNAVGLLLPPFLVPNPMEHLNLNATVNPNDPDNQAQVGADLKTMYLGVAIYTTAVFALFMFLFQDEPPLPPSIAQQMQRQRGRQGVTGESSNKEFWSSLARLMRDMQYVLLLVSWALNIGVFCAINTLLSKIFLRHHPGKEQEVGVIGLLMIASGIVGSFICGYILDRTHRYMSSLMFLYIESFVGWVIFILVLDASNLFWVYISTVFFGFAMTAAQTVGLELAAEMTFPEREGTSSAVMCSAVQVFGIVLTIVASRLLGENPEDTTMWAMSFLAGSLLLACVILAIMKPVYRRQEAQRRGSALRTAINSVN